MQGRVALSQAKAWHGGTQYREHMGHGDNSPELWGLGASAQSLRTWLRRKTGHFKATPGQANLLCLCLVSMFSFQACERRTPASH